MKVFLAAGHGGKDPGSLGNATNERYETIKVVSTAYTILKSEIKAPWEVVLVPHNLALEEGVRYINALSPSPERDICIEVHFNNNTGAPGTGIETYYGYRRLAEVLQKKLVDVLNLADRGVKDGSALYFNKETKPGSALVEIGFLNNIDDLTRVQHSGALALASGVTKFISLLSPTTPSPLPPVVDFEQQLMTFRKTVRDIKGRIQEQLNLL